MTPPLHSLRPSQSLRRRRHPVFPILQLAFHRSRLRSLSTAQKCHQPYDERHLRVTRSKSGFTLVELSVTIAVILVLVGAASLGIQPYLAYRDGRAAGEMLRAVKAAQLMYLSDNPSIPVASLNQGLLLPYMPNGTWPTLPTVGAVVPTIDCTVFPPVADLGGTPYDPSGSNTDGLWDVGLY
jgi:prepilin-type N-terminal cleavage/methylation domain-containing protein